MTAGFQKAVQCLTINYRPLAANEPCKGYCGHTLTLVNRLSAIFTFAKHQHTPLWNGTIEFLNGFINCRLPEVALSACTTCIVPIQVNSHTNNEHQPSNPVVPSVGNDTRNWGIPINRVPVGFLLCFGSCCCCIEPRSVGLAVPAEQQPPEQHAMQLKLGCCGLACQQQALKAENQWVL